MSTEERILTFFAGLCLFAQPFIIVLWLLTRVF